MNPIDFNPTPPPSDPDRDHKAEARRADEDKRVEQAAAFKQAMQRRAPGEAGRPAAPIAPPPPAPPPKSASSPRLTPAAAPPRGEAATTTAKPTNATANGSTAASTSANSQAAATSTGTHRSATHSLDGEAGASLLGSRPSDQENVDEVSLPGFGGSADADTAIPAAGAAGTGNNTRQQSSREQSTDNGGGYGGAKQHALEGKAAMEKSQPRRKSETTDRKPSTDAAAPRIDLASIIPSFPTPQPTAAAAPALTAPPRGVNTALIEQIVQFAAVGHNSLGQAEMHMGLAIGAKTRVGVRLTACGQRRIRLCFSGLAQSDLIGESQINALVDSLRGRDIEVTEMLLE